MSLTTYAEQAAQMRPEVKDRPAERAMDEGRTSAMERLDEILQPEVELSPEERMLVTRAWEHLFSEALGGSLTGESVRATLADLDSRWYDASRELLMGLDQEAFDRMEAASDSEGASADEAQAAGAVQFAAMQLYGEVEVPRLFPKP